MDRLLPIKRFSFIPRKYAKRGACACAAENYCYGNWKPIDARKFGFDVSVRPPALTGFSGWRRRDSVREVKGGSGMYLRSVLVYFSYVTFVSVVSFNDVARTISHSFASLTREILFLPLEHKIHIFSPPCNILYVCALHSLLT